MSPRKVYGSNQIELAWTVVPVLIVVILFLATARYIFGIEGHEPTPSALNVTVVDHQWWWEIRYPDLGIVSAVDRQSGCTQTRCAHAGDETVAR